MNPWEARALEHQFQDNDNNNKGKQNENPSAAASARPATTTEAADSSQQQLFYPGLYAPSGLDIMAVLFRVFSRPDPQVDLGPVDASAALCVCDLALPDAPIVYASDAFLELTGYRADEVVGRNCRFLQGVGVPVSVPVPGSGSGVGSGSGSRGAGRGKGKDGGSSSSSSSSKKYVVDKKVVRGMRDAVRANREHQARITNFKKSGEPFVNIVTMIPIPWDGPEYRYSVGFQCRVE